MAASLYVAALSAVARAQRKSSAYRATQRLSMRALRPAAGAAERAARRDAQAARGLALVRAERGAPAAALGARREAQWQRVQPAKTRILGAARKETSFARERGIIGSFFLAWRRSASDITPKVTRSIFFSACGR